MSAPFSYCVIFDLTHQWLKDALKAFLFTTKKLIPMIKASAQRLEKARLGILQSGKA
jgi:hypothetical protein